MSTIVISQPMFLPWIGLFEQIKLCDTYVHYNDVQLPQGRSFMNRVQIKTAQGIQWITAPIKRNGMQLIKDAEFDESKDWRKNHLERLKHEYSKAPYFNNMFELANLIYSNKTKFLSDFNINAIEIISAYYELKNTFNLSSKIGTSSSSSDKLLEIILELKGNIYITGHGAKNYLNYDLFEKNNIRVEFIDYKKKEYPQINGEFSPYVSILDLIANTGKDGIDNMCSKTKYWRDFINGSN